MSLLANFKHLIILPVFILMTVLMIPGSVLARDTKKVVHPPAPVLMNSTEIQSLPSEDRGAYLRSVKDILSKSPYKFLVEDSAECDSATRSCAPALYGKGLCISRRSVTPEKDCEALAKKQNGYSTQSWLFLPDSETVWTSYENKLNDVCSRPDSNVACQRLRNKRIEVFMNRRTH